MYARLRLSLLLALPLLSLPGQAEEKTLEPLPAVAPAPDDNPTTEERVALGRRLFFEPLLSGDNSMSCATCHAPEKGFGDGVSLGKGAGGRELARNSQTVLNTGFFSSLFWDGRAASLEEQALGPITSPDEMAQDVDELVDELAAIPSYVAEFKRVFGREVNVDDIARALAAYQRKLITLNSPFDRYLAGDEDALSPAAKQGLALFRGDADCIRCHNGPLLSDGKFYRVGVNNTDVGRAAVTNDPKDRYRFRTPTLRNVAETGPYMHDGSMETLFDVVEFYYRRVPQSGPEGTTLDIESLLWQSYSEIDLIVAFLESLSGELPAQAR